jgi:hypothetical protein
MNDNDRDLDQIEVGRRELLNALASAGGVLATRVLLPAVWSTPILASMALPAHAAMSSSVSQAQEPAQDSSATPGSGAGGVAIVATVVSGKVKLVITPPAALISARTQYQVYESLTPSGASEPFVRIVGLMTPSADSTLSGSVTLELERSAGAYKYQLRWDGGHTAWVSVNVA